jgi:hypothetical protein
MYMVEYEKHEKDDVYEDIHKNLLKMVPKVNYPSLKAGACWQRQG